MSLRWDFLRLGFGCLLLAALGGTVFAQIDQSSPLGGPLRKQLKPDKPFCYGTDYDTAHLEKHPGQMTASIRVSRGKDEIAAYATTGKPETWPDGADIDVSITTRENSDAVQQGYNCMTEGDQWRCTSKASADAGCEMSTREIFLQQGTEGTITLANPNDGLPSLDLCAANAAGATKSDDLEFQLSQMPLSACGL